MKQAMGKGGVALVMVLAVAMSVLAFLTEVPAPPVGDAGICLPSPSQWNLPPLISWLLNLALLLGTTAGIYLFNKQFSVVPGPSAILAPIFLLMTVSIPWIGGTLTGSAIITPVALSMLSIFCSAYGSRNASQEVFLVATLLSFGSMIQYAFVFMIVPAIVIAALFKCLRIREILAMLLGLMAPYWIVLGLGLVSPDSLRLPALSYIFDSVASKESLFICMLNLGFSAVIAMILALYNGIKLYAGNTRRRLFNLAICFTGLFALAGMIVDFNNFSAYVVTFYLTAAFQLADMFALWNIRRQWIWALIICCVYVGFFSASIF